MARVSALTHAKAQPESRKIWDAQVKAHGRMTNMKRTLAHSPLALRVLMEWYPLRDAVVPFLGERATTLFAHAISTQSDCLICSTFFRRILIDAGENPDQLKLDEKESLVVKFGRQLVVNANNVSDELTDSLSQKFSEEQIVTLTVFGAMMVATNIFNDAMGVELDDYLEPYRGIPKKEV